MKVNLANTGLTIIPENQTEKFALDQWIINLLDCGRKLEILESDCGYLEITEDRSD